MASKFSQVDLKPPKTLVTDVPPAQLKENESPDLRNVITSEGDTVRRRRGWRRKLNMYNVANGITPTANPVLVGVRAADRNTLLHYRTFAGANPANWAPFYYYSGVDGAAFGLSPTEGADYTVLVQGTLGGTLTLGSNTTETYKSVFGKTIKYDGAVYGVSTSEYSGRRRSFTTNGAITSTHLTRWNGLTPITGSTSSRTATLTNGLTTGTFNAGSIPAFSVAGYFLQVDSGTPNKPLDGYWYTYKIISHTAGAAGFVLERPYGLGESLVNVPNLTIAAGDLVNVKSEVDVANAPYGIAAVNQYKERIFTARGFLEPAVGAFSGYYGNMLAWSQEGQPEKWPSQNFLLVDDDYSNPIMGMGTIAGMQVVFKRNTALIMTGDDESSFTIDKFLTNIGCISSSSITNFEDKLIWAGEDGMYSFDGETVDEITQPEPNRGIKKVYRGRVTKDGGFNDKWFMRYPNIKPVRNTLVVTLNEAREAERDNAYTYDMRNKTWCEFGQRASDTQYSANLTSADQMIQGFFTLNNVNYAVLKWQIVDIDKCFEFDQFGTMNVSALENVDQFYENTAATATIVPNAVVQYPDVTLGNSDTVRLKEVQVNHNAHFHSASAVANGTAWRFNLSTDPAMATVDKQYTIESHDVVAGAYPTIVVPSDQYFMDRFPDTYSLEGSVFRVKLDAANFLTVTPGTSDRVHTIRFLIEPTKTRLDRNQ